MNEDKVCQKLEQLGLVLPAPMQLPPGMVAKFPMVRIVGQRCLISGHGPLNADGTIAQPLGKVGAEVDIEQAVLAARLTTLAILSSLKTELGSLDRITAWGRVMGMVNSAPGFNKQTPVIDGFSNLINELFDPDVAAHSRAAVGMAELPMGIPVEIEAEVYFE
ncbi:MAG: RidA family protein [Pseudomonadales bacterium]